MALGGGNFITHDKILPGSYINFVSAQRATSMLSDRGVVAMPLELDWCPDGEVFEVTSNQFERYSFEKFGYEINHPKLKGLRDLFKNIKKGYFYKLNIGTKASNIYATAKYSGTRGNDIKIVVANNVDVVDKFDVLTLVDHKTVDKQTVTSSSNLIGNRWVDFKTDSNLELTVATPLTGGTNGSDVTGAEYQDFLNKIEQYNFNTLGCLAIDEGIKNVFVSFTERMRNRVGAKFQTVLYRCIADFEGVISVENKVNDNGEKESSAVYWTTGVQAGCDVSNSNTNKKYDGEFSINTEYAQIDLEEGLQSGKFMFHNVDGDIRVLEDINTYISFTEQMNEDFSSNQTIRVLDQIGKDIAILFNVKYLGKVPNSQSGRISFWDDIVTHHKELQNKDCIEDFKASDVEVLKGDDKKTVIVNDAITVINAMSKLYMTVSVR